MIICISNGGIAKGIEQIIKNMLNLDIGKETISKVSGKTIKEIESKS